MTYNQAINYMTSSGMTQEQIDGVEKAIRNNVTVGQILDLIDNNRESEEMVHILNGNGDVEVSAMVCSMIWSDIEDRSVNSMRAQGDCIEIWLDD